MGIARSAFSAPSFFLAALLSITLPLASQSPAGLSAAALKSLHVPAQTSRIASGADLTPQTQLTHHLPPWAIAERQTTAAVDLSTPVQVWVVLSRPAAVEAAFEQLLADQQTPGSPFYHQWLTPQQIGELYGPTQSDLDAVTAWATSQGLTVASVAPNRVIIQLSGSLASVGNAFHTTFAYFNAGTESRLSAISEPFVPTAFAPVIQSIHGLSQMHFYPQSSMKQITLPAVPVSGSRQLSPNVYLGAVGENLILPNDFAVIYDVASVYSGGNTGATIGSKAQHIAVIGRSRVSTADVTYYDSLAGLSTSLQPNVVLAGTDPGTTGNGDQGEANLDVERTLGTAPGAITDLIIAKSTTNADGVDLAIQYNIYTQLDPVMTISFGSCEANDGQSEVNFYNNEFQTAAGEGISTFVSSGDSGASGCEASFAAPTGTQVRGVNTLCSQYVTCVGGTEFNDASSYGTYWKTSNGVGNESAISYIPEGAWNEPTGGSVPYQLASSGGGVSLYITKPSWQAGTGVPADGFRDDPDVAFTAASHDGYLGCYATGGGSCISTSQGTPIIEYSGTSAAAPGMAGVAALLNTKLGAAQGNINPLLYKIATSTPNAFHDATIATSGVTGCTTATPSMCNNSTPSASALTGGLAGFALTTGYDQATGLGSLDVANFLNAASNSTVATTLAVTAAPNPGTVGQAVTLTATLTPGTSANTPTGTVQFYYYNGSASVPIGSAATLTSKVATLSYTFTTAGTYSIYAIYTSGDTNFASSTAPTISVVINAGAFSVTPATTSYALISGATSGNTDTIAVASTNSFAGTVALTCAVTNASGTAAGTCSLANTSVALTAGGSANSTLTITTTAGTAGVLKVIVTGTNGTTAIQSSAITVALTAPSFTLAASPTTLSFTSGATTGNADTITVTSVNTYAGPVVLSCSISSGGYYPPSCAVSLTSVTLTSGGTATAVVTITSTTAHTASSPGNRTGLDPRWTFGGTAVLAMILCLPMRRRGKLRSLAGLAILALGLASFSGCSNSSNTAPKTVESSAGNYTVTVSGSGSTNGTPYTATPATFTVTIN